MRLIRTAKSHDEIQRMALFLEAQGIACEVDSDKVQDWGSHEYGDPVFHLFVIDEDLVEKANHVLEDYRNHPPPLIITPALKPFLKPRVEKKGLNFTKKSPVTNFLILLCVLIFTWNEIKTPSYSNDKEIPALSPIFASKLKQDLLYDFPETFTLLNQLVKKFGVDGLKSPDSLPEAGKELVMKINHTPYFQGYYEETLNVILKGSRDSNAPWFEKIKQGEWWRTITPIFLHGDIFHLLFNMLWLFVLGRQLEYHLKPFRFLVFILLTAAFSNTAQYFMSGANFIGFSGVLCAMLTYIWRRQVEAPSEIYQLQPSTFNFMMIFILGMAGLQMLSFLLEAMTGTTISTSIANTAHLTGALAGIALSKVPFFTQKKAL